MAAKESISLILFSGLAADANVFAPQQVAFPQLVVPAWPKPEPGDTLDTYCRRIAEDLRSYGDAIIGGASFGGIIALHVAQHMQPLSVILIGSVRAPSELSPLARSFRPLRLFAPLIPVRLLQLCCFPFSTPLARRIAPHLCELACQFRGSDPTVFKWSLSRILDWRSTPSPSCPIHQIHGDRDRVLPMRHTHPDKIVPGGGHVISLTHATEVNDFIHSTIAETLGGSG